MLRAIVRNIDPSGLVKVADGVMEIVGGVGKMVDEGDGIIDIAKGTGKVTAGVGTFLGFIKSDEESDDC